MRYRFFLLVIQLLSWLGESHGSGLVMSQDDNNEPGKAQASTSQTPKPPFPYQSEEVAFENTQAKVKLAGTMTIPPGKGPFPAVLLVTGSGPQDRDETLLHHKPFLVIADALTRRGIAVLRYDDRGIGKSTGTFGTSTTFDFAWDAQAGVQYLKGRSEVDGKRIGIIGHSEGGTIAPIVAARCQEVAFIVMLAGTGITGEEISTLQGKLIAQASGIQADEIAAGAKIQSRVFQIAKAEKPSPELVKKLKSVVLEEVNKLPEEIKQRILKTRLGPMNAQLQLFSSPWFVTFMLHDPRPTLRQVKCPVLALNGEKDMQVPWKENLTEIEKALKEGGNTKVVIKSFPNLNHLFQSCSTGAPSEYFTIRETIHPPVLQLIGDWILQQ